MFAEVFGWRKGVGRGVVVRSAGAFFEVVLVDQIMALYCWVIGMNKPTRNHSCRPP